MAKPLSENHPPVLIMFIVGSSAFLAAEDEAARGLWASNLAMSIPVSLNYPPANSTNTNSMIRVKVSQQQLSFLYSRFRRLFNVM